MEAEARAILEAVLSAPDDESTDLGAFARGLFAPLGGVELELPSRSSPPPQLDGAEEAPAEAVEPAGAAMASPPDPAADRAPAAATAGARSRRT